MKISKTMYRKCLLITLVIFTLTSIIAIDIVWKNEQQTYSTINLKHNSKYVLKPLDGVVAVYDIKSQNLINITGVYLNTLPEYDQQSIKIGLFVKDDEQLSKILEDFEN